MLQATLVCRDTTSVLEAYSRCSSAFELRKRGRLTNTFDTNLPEPPQMVLNVHIDSAGGLPVVAEIQIHLQSIFQLMKPHLRLSEVRRAASVESLLADNRELLERLDAEFSPISKHDASQDDQADERGPTVHRGSRGALGRPLNAKVMPAQDV